MSTVPEDLKKLTIPQLKALCKDKKLTGYSKLTKNAIIQKLDQHKTVAPAVGENDQEHAFLKPLQLQGTDTSRFQLQKATPSEEQQKIVPAVEKTATSEEPLPANGDDIGSVCMLVQPGQAPVETANPQQSFSVVQLTANKKRPLASSEPLSSISKRHKPSSPPGSSSFSITPLPVSTGPAQAPLKSNSKPPTSSSSARSVARPMHLETRTSVRTGPASAEATGAKRFVPLVAKKPTAVVLSNIPITVRPPPIVDSVAVAWSLHYLDFPVPQQSSLKPISLPPSLSQRKQLTRLTVLLGGISIEQLKECAQVSRLFRYAAFISAVYRLERRFSGRRLDLVTSQHSPKITNMWPYLKQREEEYLERRRIYCSSFLGRVLDQHCISDRLWTSPDSDKQATVAVRFLLTRFYFAISVGSGSNDFGVVIDAQELVEGEIWRITTRSSSSTEVLYVLEATCEVVGHSPLSPDQRTVSQPLVGGITNIRADWSTYIESRASQPPAAGRIDSLMARLKWTNHEEYDRGISRLWLKKIQSQGELGAAKLLIAERYVLACIVGNSVSGRWMSSSEMAQEFNGLPSRVSSSKQNAHVHLFLPGHHHVESIHLTSPDGRALHPAVAAVQTPGREYYVLRDNGMQVGCEEEGVALVWRRLLGCDALGRLDRNM